MANANLQLPETGFVRLPTILEVFPISRSGWWSGVKVGKYPPAYKLSPGCTAWKATDIRELLDRVAHNGSQGGTHRAGRGTS